MEIKPSARHGRGVFSTRAFAEGECVLIEEPLVAAQHEGNRRHARACAGCFRFVGDVSTSIGERLLWKYGIVDEDARASTSTPLPSGLTVGDLVRLANGEARLPGTEAFDGPRAVACPGGCDRNVYCSDACAETSWRAHESMMCLGPRGASRDKEALREFYAHASETNDISFSPPKPSPRCVVARMRNGTTSRDCPRRRAKERLRVMTRAKMRLRIARARPLHP